MDASEIDKLWDHSDPAGSEVRFREALKQATADQILVIQTQIARTYGLRRRFVEAERLLTSIGQQVEAAGPEAKARTALERGRTLVSATHLPSEITLDTRDRARSVYLEAVRIARDNQLDAVAIDAMHMLAFVETDAACQLRWNEEALALLRASSQPAARQQEAMLLNNAACALHSLGRYEEALAHFQSNLQVVEQRQDPRRTRVAHWMVAWTLRFLNHIDEAIDIQLRLERECDADGAPDRYVFEELNHLFKAKTDTARAEYYAKRFAACRGAAGG